MTDLGLATWVAAGFFFFGGASVALWVDLWLRRFKSEAVGEARIILSWGADWNIIHNPPHHNVQYWYVYTQGPRVTVHLTFFDLVEKPHLYAFATKDAVRWRELQTSERHTIIEIDGRQNNSQILLGVIAEKLRAPDTRRQQPDVWQEAAYFEEIPLSLVYDEPKPGWWRRLRARFSQS